MLKTGNPIVRYLIDTDIKKSGSDFTASLADLGGRSMQQGATNLWKDGVRTGLARGTVGAVLVFGTCILIQKAIHEYRVKQAAEELAEECTTSLAPPCSTEGACRTVQSDESNEEYIQQGGHSYETD